jgi:hypothetical protein
VAGCCECGDEPSGSCATDLVRPRAGNFVANRYKWRIGHEIVATLSLNIF